MNKTKIEWSDSTWNSITGCIYGCSYCYARRQAKRFEGYDAIYGTSFEFNAGNYLLDKPLYKRTKSGEVMKAPYPFGFEPTFHRYRLDELARKTKPRTIFVGSMTDLFGSWVPTSWIVEVLDACRSAPQHRYLFLTKNPQRYIELDKMALLPREDNFWYGSTAATGDMNIFSSNYHNTFVSMEPILEQFIYPPHPAALNVKWVILEAETGNRKDKVIPERPWIEPVVEFCEDNNIPIFMKDSLKPIWGEDIITEFPW